MFLAPVSLNRYLLWQKLCLNLEQYSCYRRSPLGKATENNSRKWYDFFLWEDTRSTSVWTGSLWSFSPWRKSGFSSHLLEVRFQLWRTCLEKHEICQKLKKTKNSKQKMTRVMKQYNGIRSRSRPAHDVFQKTFNIFKARSINVAHF